MSENFLNASDAAITGFIAGHAEEFGTSDVSTENILKAIAEQRMAIEHRSYGFALLEIEGRPGWFLSPGVNLCCLYVLPEYRKRGIGRKFVRELIEKHAVQYRRLSLRANLGASNSMNLAASRSLRIRVTGLF